MSSDEDFDSEVYRDFQDQLYHEDSSSEEDIEFDIVEALYSQVHYASSLLVSEKPISGGKNTVKRTDDKDKSIIEISSDSDCDDNTSVDCVSSDPLYNYPEVINLYSDLNNTQRASQKLEGGLEKNEGEPGEIIENWHLNEKDLEDSNNTKRRSRYYLPGKRLLNVRCHNCNGKGHLSMYCPEPKKMSVCHLCGSSGHLRKNCPNEVCFNCREPGHRSKQCSKPRRPFVRCRRCHVLGHVLNECPDRWRQYHLTTEVGPIVRPDRPASPPRSVHCYNCGYQGHYGHECMEGIAFRKGELPLPFVVRYDGHHMPSGGEKNITDKNKTAREPRRHRAHHSKAERRYGEATQLEDYGAQDTHDYDRDRLFPRGPSNKVQKLNHGNYRDSFKEGTHQNGEFDKSYKNHSLTKSGKKRHGRETNERDERIVEFSTSIPMDEGLFEESYHTKKKKMKKRIVEFSTSIPMDEGLFEVSNHSKKKKMKKRIVEFSTSIPMDEGLFEESYLTKKMKKRKQQHDEDNLHQDNPTVGRRKINLPNNYRRFENSHREKDFRSFQDEDANERTSRPKNRRNFTSNRGFRSYTHFKRYTF
ncbi:zinc finger CCHC domain-containing protein 7-like isoform X1 [Montipora foliosa]|uniref:zinc finger CCHC domain-containing protein 7-like isoform X1 n=1 Tax=Montipora foliosa TaxID=591990 RepID=UPI0035F19714